MKLVFREVKPMEDCFNDALEKISNAIKNRSSGVANIKTAAAFRNRVVSYAVYFYLKNNWKKTDVIECEYRAAHYGKPIGTVMERRVEYGDIKTNNYLELLKRARKISLSLPISTFSLA